MSVEGMDAGRSAKRLTLLWRMHGVCLLGGGLFVFLVTAWLLIGFVGELGLFDSNIGSLYALLGTLALLSLVLSVEGLWRVVFAQPSVWGARLMGFGLICFIVLLTVLCIREGVNPLNDG